MATNNGNGALSPTQGRSLREYDEKLQALRKENFNLKLRVYFLEEKSPNNGSNKNGSMDAKQNIDLKVENESLRKELHEKQELLKQAASAMSSLEENANKLRETISELNQKNKQLQVSLIGESLVVLNGMN